MESPLKTLTDLKNLPEAIRHCNCNCNLFFYSEITTANFEIIYNIFQYSSITIHIEEIKKNTYVKTLVVYKISHKKF